jgi:hypothetical protein
VAATVLSKTSNKATISLSVGIIDNTAPGDVTKAVVEFKLEGYNNNNWFTVPVQALNTPKTIGNASKVVEITFSGDGASPTFNYRISGYYQIDDACSDNGESVINIYKPQNDFITGGGYIKPTNSIGIMASDPGRKANFGFNVKYNKTNKNLQGHINYIFRKLESDGVVHVYQVKGNAMTSLTVLMQDPNEGGLRTSIFEGKCNVSDVTYPDAPVSVPGTGNSVMQVKVTDAGEPGTADKYGITVWNSDNGVLYSSNWVSTKTEKLTLIGGNIVVHSGTATLTVGGTVIKSASLTTAVAEVSTEPTLKAYPNPFTERLNIEFSSETDTQGTLEIYSITGAKLATLFNGPVNGGELYTVDYLPNLVSSQMVFYHLTMNGKTQVGKVVYQERR